MMITLTSLLYYTQYTSDITIIIYYEINIIIINYHFHYITKH